VNAELEHREYSDSLAPYVLGALPEEESARVRRHLVDCRECRAEFEWLRVAADALPGSVQPIDPPPELKARIMRAVESEAELLRAAGAAADRPQPRRPSIRWRWLPTGWLRPGLALGAAGLLALGLVLAFTGGGPGTRTIPAHVSGPGQIQASVVVRGGRAQLAVTGLPSPGTGHVYELWVQPGQGPPRPAGTFVVRSGPVEVERRVKHGDLVMVTIEPGLGTQAPTTKPFIVARV
jgi:anti-sigma-K factor RskA